MAQEGDAAVSGKRPKKKKEKSRRQKKQEEETKVKPKKPWPRSQQASPPTWHVLDAQSHHEADQVAALGDEQSRHADQVAPDDVAAFDSGSDDSGVVHEGALDPAAALQNVTVATAYALHCSVCFLPLRSPIFQCEVGHVVCSACRDKLEATGDGSKCHACGIATLGGYRRCHAMEHLLDCIRVPCPYAAHGCDATPPYHAQQSHRQVCPHAPCHCPAGDSCGFIASTAPALLDHFAGGAHGWPCTTKVCAGVVFTIGLHLGFNFILLADDDDGEQPSATAGIVPCRLFLLNVTQERLGRAISVLGIHPHQLPSTQCELVFMSNGDGSLCRSHYQTSVFDVMCTDLSKGLPNPEDCFQFIVPNALLGDDGDDDKNSIQVKARIIN